MSPPEWQFPELSWSHSRDRTLRECARRYYWQYYGSAGGWSPDASRTAAMAFRLKQLTTLEMALGTAVHECARMVATAIRDRRPRPARAALAAHCRAALNGLWRSSRDRAAFEADPRGRPMLQALYYGREVGAEALERVRRKLERCVDNLVACPVWAELARCDPAQVYVVDSLTAFLLEGKTVYASPDLAYVSAEGVCTLCDWKTGHPGEAGEQVALYALYARKALGITGEGEEVTGRVFLWGRSGEEIRLTVGEPEVRAAGRRVQRSMAAMRTLLADPDRNVPLPMAAFPVLPSEARSRCPSCNFYGLCRGELEVARGPDGRVAAGDGASPAAAALTGPPRPPGGS